MENPSALFLHLSLHPFSVLCLLPGTSALFNVISHFCDVCKVGKQTRFLDYLECLVLKEIERQCLENGDRKFNILLYKALMVTYDLNRLKSIVFLDVSFTHFYCV